MYDSIIIGLGGMGSATAYHLARRGQRVLGLEQFGFVHDRGSSHGQSRIIRMAYFEHPDYVPLLQRAYALWDELAEGAEAEIINLCGMFMAGLPEDDVIAGTRRAAATHGLPLESISPGAALGRFPGLCANAEMDVVYDPLGGYLRVEACVAAHLAGARAAGADLHENEAVLSWERDGDGICVTTALGRYHAASLVICAGAWASMLLRELKLPLAAHRVVSAWFQSDSTAHDVASGAPVFGIQTGDGFFYGFPKLDPRGVKIAKHAAAQLLRDPDHVNREVSNEDVEAIQSFAARHIPGVQVDSWNANTCIYTMTPDEHFIVDRHPEQDNVFLAAGFSGHGFKFTPVIGEIMADFCIDGATKQPAAFLGLARFL